MADRRTLLCGLAALPLATVPLDAIPNRLAGGEPDPFATYHRQILDLDAAIEVAADDEAAGRLMDRWGEIDRSALAARPTTLAGAIGALQYARREHRQFAIEGLEATGCQPDTSSRLVLHLIDGALGVLQQAMVGGAA